MGFNVPDLSYFHSILQHDGSAPAYIIIATDLLSYWSALCAACTRCWALRIWQRAVSRASLCKFGDLCRKQEVKQRMHT